MNPALCSLAFWPWNQHWAELKTNHRRISSPLMTDIGSFSPVIDLFQDAFCLGNASEIYGSPPSQREGPAELRRSAATGTAPQIYKARALAISIQTRLFHVGRGSAAARAKVQSW